VSPRWAASCLHAPALGLSRPPVLRRSPWVCPWRRKRRTDGPTARRSPSSFFHCSRSELTGGRGVSRVGARAHPPQNDQDCSSHKTLPPPQQQVGHTHGLGAKTDACPQERPPHLRLGSSALRSWAHPAAPRPLPSRGAARRCRRRSRSVWMSFRDLDSGVARSSARVTCRQQRLSSAVHSPPHSSRCAQHLPRELTPPNGEGEGHTSPRLRRPL
jgi:hypothetical protein